MNATYPARSIFLVAFLFSSLASGQSIDAVHDLSMKGIDRLYHLEFEEAERTFDLAIDAAPNDPRGYFFKSMIFYWIYNLSKDRKAFDKFFELSEKVIQLCGNILDEDENNEQAKFYLGGIYGYRGLAYQRDGSLISAIWDGRKGYSLLKEVATRSQTIHDAQMGFGLFNYLLAKIPRSFRWVLSLLGFRGDLEGGLASLKRAADHGMYTSNEAAFFYAQFSYFEERQQEAYTYLRRLLGRFPDNSLFLVTFAQWELRNNSLDTAMTLANRAVAINTTKNIRYGDEFAYNILASCYYAQDDFVSAQENIELSILHSENNEVFNATYYRLGLCYDLLGQREKAIGAYRMMKPANRRDNPWQYYHYRLGRQRIVQTLNDIDIQLIKAGNAVTLKKHETALSLYQSVSEGTGSNVDQRSLALYHMSGILFERGEFPEVVSTIRRLLLLTPQQETWLLPHGLLRLGIAQSKLGDFAGARSSLEEIEDYDDYDFQDRTETRAEEELSKLSAIK